MVQLRKKTGPDDEVADDAGPVFRSITNVAPRGTVLDDKINQAFLKMRLSFDSSHRDGSGWRLKEVKSIDVTTLQQKQRQQEK